MNRYVMVTGLHVPEDVDPESEATSFIARWCQNLMEHTRPLPDRIQVFATGVNALKAFGQWATPEVSAMVDFPGEPANLGHVHNLIGKEEPHLPHAYCGWSASVLAGAMIAYCSNADLVYREQDVLAFGDYVGELYRQLGAGKMIFGSYIEHGQHRMPCAQSLFLIRHDWIPEFVRSYLLLPNDRQISMLPEHKFQRIERQNPGTVKRFTFGVDRGRPLPWDAPVWYAQKWTSEELAELDRRGMI